MKNFLGKIFKFKEWSDWNRNKSTFSYIKESINKFLSFENFKADKAKNFQTMLTKYNVTDEQLIQQLKVFKILSLLFILFSFSLWTYIGFQIYKGDYAISFVILCISFIPVALAFRYHFYYTLIKSRRLDCSLKDWVNLNIKKD
jgi:intracellular multiplication protein IcmV